MSENNEIDVKQLPTICVNCKHDIEVKRRYYHGIVHSYECLIDLDIDYVTGRQTRKNCNIKNNGHCVDYQED